jgi:beta-galactosidase
MLDFSWLDEAITCLARENIRSFSERPLPRRPNGWLTSTLIFFKGISTVGPGALAPGVITASTALSIKAHRGIVTEMAGHYRDNPTIIAWQIDNEFGCHNSTRCYCDNCLKAFQEWLKQKYGTVEILNSAWGTVFWSQIYNNWEDVILPMYAESQGDSYSNLDHNPGLLLDFARFSSDSAVSYQRLQIDSLRTCSQLPVTHNMMGGFDEIDYFKLAQDLDVVSWDNYPTMEWGTSSWLQTSMNHDFMRGLKDKPFWSWSSRAGLAAGISWATHPGPVS